MKEFINKLIERLEEYPHGKYEDEYGKGFSNGINVAIKEVNELAEEYNNGWIACSERLPDEEEMKRAYCRNKRGCEFIVIIEGATRQTTLYRTLDGFWLDEHSQIYNVTDWQPLPELSKKGE